MASTVVRLHNITSEFHIFRAANLNTANRCNFIRDNPNIQTKNINLENRNDRTRNRRNDRFRQNDVLVIVNQK